MRSATNSGAPGRLSRHSERTGGGTRGRTSATNKSTAATSLSRVRDVARSQAAARSRVRHPVEGSSADTRRGASTRAPVSSVPYDLPPAIRSICVATAIQTGVTLPEFFSRGRPERIARARMIAMFVSFHETNFSKDEIDRFFLRSNGAIYHALRSVADEQSVYPATRELLVRIVKTSRFMRAHGPLDPHKPRRYSETGGL